MTEMRQTITCPNCDGKGWPNEVECPVCDARGFLVIDSAATSALPQQPFPRPLRKSGPRR